MKTIANNSQALIKFYVAVLYKWHPYFPDYLDSINDELKGQIIKDATSVKILLLSSTASSDLIEFAKYKFGFKISGEDYKERFLNTYLDSYSREVVGIDFRDLQKIENNAVLQKSSEQKESLPIDGEYFGAISMDNNQIYMVDAGEDIWKIEFYEELRSEYIEYSVREKFRLDTTQKPILTIELGPESDCYNNYIERKSEDKDLYLDLYYPNGKYKNRNDVELSDIDYRNLCQEITNKKVFYIVQTPNELTSVNISLAAWNKSELPHRNKKNWNVTNDHYKGAIDNEYNIFTTQYNNSLVDTSSMILLGNQEINLTNTPILKEKIELCERNENFYKREITYKKNDVVIYELDKYKSLSDNNTSNDPDVSKYWEKLGYISMSEKKIILSIFNQEKEYGIGDSVIYNGKRYESISINNTTVPGTDGSKWKEKREINAEEKSIIESIYSIDKEYKINSCIIYTDYKKYKCLIANKNKKPDISEYWEKLKYNNEQEKTLISHNYRDNLVYNEGDIVTFRGFEYKSLINGNIFDNPEISCYWTRLDKKGDFILDRIEKEKEYKSILVMSENGNVFPFGNISAKVMNEDGHWYKTFELEERLGAVFSYLLIDSKYSLSKNDLTGYYREKEIGLYDFYLNQAGLYNKDEETKKLPFKQFEFIFREQDPVINLHFIVNEDYYNNAGKNLEYKNLLPQGFSVIFNGKTLTSISGGLNMKLPQTKYEVEVLCDNEYYKLNSQPKVIGTIEKNRTDLVFDVLPREYISRFSNSHEHGIVINGDSSKICYYKQSITIEFSIEDEDDFNENHSEKYANYIMCKKLIINGRSLDQWKNSEYRISLSGGGNIESEKNNNYILTINNINQDFNIIYKP